jgi:hypothetical protein
LFSRCGFAVVDTAPPDYEFLALRFTGGAPPPKFRSIPKDVLKKYAKGLTIIRSDQCPHAVKFAREIAEFAQSEYGLAPRIVVPESMRDAPTPYAVFSIIYNGQLLADHQISRTRFHNIMKKLLAQEAARG